MGNETIANNACWHEGIPRVAARARGQMNLAYG